jgi:lysylphosphatidylglycerol synthetase-like protein (DUF2156 family)
MVGSSVLAETVDRQRLHVGNLDSSGIGELARARATVAARGEDSLSPFLLRPDKDFEFAGGGVLVYGMFGRTMVVSGDPVRAG